MLAAAFSSWRLRLGELGTSLLAPWDTILALSLGPWEEQDGHEVGLNKIFIDFELILRLIPELFRYRGSKFQFVSGLLPGHFFSLSESTF